MSIYNSIEAFIRGPINDFNILQQFFNTIMVICTILTTYLTCKYRNNAISEKKENDILYGLLEEKESRYKSLKEELDNEKMKNISYWINAENEKYGSRNICKVEFFQKAFVNTVDDMFIFFTEFSLSRLELFLLGNQQVDIEEAERFSRISYLLKPNSEESKKLMNSIIEEMVLKNIAVGVYSPEDRRLNDYEFFRIKSFSKSDEQILKILFEYGMKCVHKGLYFQSERVFNRARIISSKTTSRCSEINLKIRYWHINSALLIGLSSYVSEEIDILKYDANECLEKNNKLYIEICTNVITTLKSLERFEDCLKEIQELLPIIEKTNGKKHPFAMNVRYNLCCCLSKMHHYEEALKHIQDLIPEWEEVIKLNKNEHVADTFYARTLWIDILDKLGRHEEALQAIEELLPNFERACDNNHPELLYIYEIRDGIREKLGCSSDKID